MSSAHSTQAIKIQLFQPTEDRPWTDLPPLLKKPFNIYLEANRFDGIIGTNGAKKLDQGQSGSCSQVMVRSEREGTGTLEIRFFGIPVRRVNLVVEKMPEVIPGGHAIGVLVAQQGVIVTGHLPVRDDRGKEFYPAEEAGVKVGDLLIAINGQAVHRIHDVDSIIQQEAAKGLPLTLTLIRDGQTPSVRFIRSKNQPAGRDRPLLPGSLWEDPAAGVGTLTYYNPKPTSMALWAIKSSVLAIRTTFNPREDCGSPHHGINQGNRGEPGKDRRILGNSDIIGIFSGIPRLGFSEPSGRACPIHGILGRSRFPRLPRSGPGRRKC